jgi:hypothetical protein
MRRTLKLSLSFAVALTLGACGDGGTGPSGDDGSGGGSGGGGGRSILPDPSFSGVIQEIFNRRGCASSSCHGAALAAGLDLRAGSSYANLVNITSNQVSTALVIPGNANDSYLIVKAEGRQTVGQRMPIGGAPLDNIDLTNLKNWINQGAKNN